MARRLRPRAPITPMAICVSQHTAPMLAGFKTERSFLDFVQANGVPHARHGKTVLVDAADLLAAIADKREAGTSADASAEGDDDKSPETVDDVLATIGRVRRKGAA